ncbi:uncharacterized protein [Aegilops tauschii subsp. strangulata]|uniref:uncharacterized protein n=1 Tax=Aegilops tauschii subsp. strangulata TaxID=200361 RepID=UPI003CC85F20
MAEEPSAKRPCGETSDQSTEVDDIQVPGQKHDYKVHLKEVDIHGKEKLDVVCTSNPEEADKMISRILKRVCGLYPQYIGVDVEPKSLHLFLKEDRFYTFAGFSIEGDKEMLRSSGLEINPDKERDPPFYKQTKDKIDRVEDHKLWGISPLPNYLIEYASIDAYAPYESWKRIENIREGLESAKEAEKNYDDTYYGY